MSTFFYHLKGFTQCTNKVTVMVNVTLVRDHAGGNVELTGLVKGLTVCGGDDRIGALSKKVGHGDKLKVCSNIQAIIIIVCFHFVMVELKSVAMQVYYRFQIYEPIWNSIE